MDLMKYSPHRRQTWLAFAFAATCQAGIALAQSPLQTNYPVVTESTIVSSFIETSPPVVIANGVSLSDASGVSPVVTAGYSSHITYAANSFQPSQLVWSNWIAQAKQNLRADTLPNPTTAKIALEQSLQNLDAYLATSGDSRYISWRKFLKWDDLQKEITSPEPDIEQLVQFERNMRQNYLGLEYPQFLQVRQSLSSYIDALRFGSQPESTIEALSKRLDQLSTALQTPPTGSDIEREREIGLVVSFLSASKQTPELLQLIHTQFSQPNVRVLASADFISRQFTRPVHQATPVNEMILGTHVCGQSWLTGSVTPQLIDNPRSASIRLALHANFSSDNIGTNRGVKVYTRGSANIYASESILLTDNGLVSMGDTCVSGALRSDITNIDHRLRIVEKIASKKAAEQKPIANQIGEGRLKSRLGKQFHLQLQEQLSEANSRLAPPPLPALQRFGVDRPVRSTSTSNQYLNVLWKQQSKLQLASSGICRLPTPTQGISFQIHQSALINAIDPVLSGRILRNGDLNKLVAQFGVAPNQKMMEEAKEEPWSITMAGYHPVEVEFDDQLVRFRIRTTKLDRGDQALDQQASIVASYRIVLIDGGIQLERVGDVQIDFVGKAQRGLRAVTLRSFLKNKFDTVFKPQLFDKPLRPTDRLPSNIALQLREVQIDDGWLQATLY